MQLLERESSLASLAGYAEEARRGDGRLALVAGEPGIGKTVLLEAFQCRTTGTRWLWGACDGLLTPRPLGPLFDIASQAGGELRSDRLPGHSGGGSYCAACGGRTWFARVGHLEHARGPCRVPSPNVLTTMRRLP